jgi:hypothetical protein
MNDKVWKNVSKAMELLYDACVQTQADEKMKHFRKDFAVGTDKNFIQHMCEWMTVRVGCPRRSGKSHAIVSLVKKKKLKAAIVLPTLEMGQYYQGSGIPTFSWRTVGKMKNLDLDVVFVDEAAFVGNMKAVATACVPYIRRGIKEGKPFVFFLASTELIEG